MITGVLGGKGRCLFRTFERCSPPEGERAWPLPLGRSLRCESPRSARIIYPLDQIDVLVVDRGLDSHYCGMDANDCALIYRAGMSCEVV
jgi:hypothetical protein